MASVREEADELRANTALLDGVKQIAMDVRELDIDMIDSINPWHAAYTVLAKAMNENTLRQVQAAISAKRTKITPEEAKELAGRAVRFRREREHLPSITASDAWERRLAEGAAAFMRYREEGRYG
jgi:hypothetical protein